MSLSTLYERSDSGSNQLSLQFSQNIPPFPRAQIADQVHAITSGKFTFHPEKSEMNGNKFVLKISYMGRSYSLEGVYKREEIRSPYDREDMSTIFRFVSFDKLFAYRNGSYNIPAFLPKAAYDEITKNANSILSGSYNHSLLLH